MKSAVWVFVWAFLGSLGLLEAKGLKKVLILDVVNVDNNAKYQYLEPSITEAVRKKLRDKFAFKETPELKWREVAKKNYLLKKDFHTTSVAMNLGLLAKQDVVIAGGYRVKEGPAPEKPTTGEGNVAEPQRQSVPDVVTTVRILDVSKRRVISEFDITIKADSSIFASIDKIAVKISDEAKAVLPDKSTFQKTGIVDDDEDKPLIENPVVGISLGGAFYASGYADRISANQPALGFLFKAHMPVLWWRLIGQFQVDFVKHSWKREFNNITERNTINSDNFIFGLFIAVDYQLLNKYKYLKKVSMYPRVGGGYIIQTISITGQKTVNTTNAFPFIGVGFELTYPINRFLDGIFDLQSIVEIEEGTSTLLSAFRFGIQFKLGSET